MFCWADLTGPAMPCTLTYARMHSAVGRKKIRIEKITVTSGIGRWAAPGVFTLNFTLQKRPSAQSSGKAAHMHDITGSSVMDLDANCHSKATMEAVESQRTLLACRWGSRG